MDRCKLQLYHYRWNKDKDMGAKFNKQVDPRMPDVLHDLNWPNKKKFNSFLEVELQFCNRSTEEIKRKHFSRAPWEKEVSLYNYEQTMGP